MAPAGRSDGPFRPSALQAEYRRMTMSNSFREIGTTRHPVSIDRVSCWRLGPVVLDRCRECVYLVRLEGATARHAAAAYVVCADQEPEVDFAW